MEPTNSLDVSVFVLDQTILEQYSKKPSPFGFNGLGDFVFERTYSRVKDNGMTETWADTVYRVVCGTYTMQKQHINSPKVNTGWNEEQAQRSAKEMYDRIFNLKFTPPGRGLWAMGTDIINKRHLYSALCNCSFRSTENIDKEYSIPFRFLMDMSMLGVGVGFDVRGANKIIVKRPLPSQTRCTYYLTYVNKLTKLIEECQTKLQDPNNSFYENSSINSDIKMYQAEIDYINMRDGKFVEHIVEDSREGWVETTGDLIDSYLMCDKPELMLNYDNIRPEGLPLKVFGGLSSGYVPLLDLHIMIKRIFERNAGSLISITTITDIMNLIGKTVISGNVRRTAEIALGEHNSEEFLNLKNYAVNPERMSWGWCSNNSILADVGMDYTDVAKRICDNGEPGIVWLDNIRKYSRMNGIVDNKDILATGVNPCSEQTLESEENCTLVEVYPTRHESIEDYLRTLKFAYLYAKTVTLGNSHWPGNNRVMMRNRRIGCSLTGITQFVAKYGLASLKEWLTRGYDEIQKWDKVYSDYFAIPLSKKTTSIKPSGCVTLNTVIKTKQGNMTLGDIFELNGYSGEYEDGTWLEPTTPIEVLNMNGEYEPISRLYVNGIKPTLDIILEDGSVISCTPEHKLLLLNGQWKRADELCAEDELAERQ